MNTTYSSDVTKLKVGLFTILGFGLVIAFTVMVNDRPYWWRPCQVVRINVEDATGIKSKSPVRSLGIDIGYLRTVNLTETHVSLGICITAPVEVLTSTRAYIRADGFLGDKFVELKPVKYIGVPTVKEPTPSSTGGTGGGSSEPGQVAPDFIPYSPHPEPEPVFPFQKQGRSPFGLLRRSLDLAWSWISPSSAWSKDLEKTAQQVIQEIPEVIPSGQAGQSADDVKVLKPTAPVKRVNTQGSGGQGREIPVKEQGQDIEHVVTKVDELVNEMTGLATNLKDAINPEELKQTMRQLNTTLANASRTLAPEGGLTQTAQRTLAKLEDAIEQLRDLAVRVNKGEGSVGMLLNDPSYADELKLALQNLNKLLNKVNKIQFVVDLGAAILPAYDGGRAWFNLGVWPRPDRYYLLGITLDPRGKITNQSITTTVGTQVQTIQTRIVEQTGMLFTAMLGKVWFNRIDLSVGALYGDGAGSAMFLLGPKDKERFFTFRSDFYIRTSGSSLDSRNTLTVMPIENFYLRAGMESVYRNPIDNRFVYFVGTGLTFTDEDIKLLLALK